MKNNDTYKAADFAIDPTKEPQLFEIMEDCESSLKAIRSLYYLPFRDQLRNVRKVLIERMLNAVVALQKYEATQEKELNKLT